MSPSVAPRRAVVVLVAGNAVPLVGVVVGGLELHTLLVVYWLEAGVVGAITVKKIRRASGVDNPAEIPDWEYSPFGAAESRSVRSLVGKPNEAIVRQFFGSYVAFWVILGVFVFALPFEYDAVGPASLWAVAVAAVGFCLSHYVTYRTEFVGGTAAKSVGPVTAMVAPFDRVLVLTITIVVGAIPLDLFGAPAGALAVLVVSKTYFDVRAHRRERA